MFAYAFIGAVTAAASYAYLHGKLAEVEYVRSQVDGNVYLVQKTRSSQEAADALGKINMDIIALIAHLKHKYPDDPRVKAIERRYDHNAVSEGSATSGYTSYSVDKERLVLCLRTDDPEEFASPNVVMYVTLHEIAHLGTEEVGHTGTFWRNFGWLLKEAIAIGIYKRQDYSKDPQSFCGIQVDSSVI